MNCTFSSIMKLVGNCPFPSRQGSFIDIETFHAKCKKVKKHGFLCLYTHIANVGFTLEPASIAINKKAFESLEVPCSRHEMIKVLRANREFFQRKVGNYDVRQSGLVCMFAMLDDHASKI